MDFIKILSSLNGKVDLGEILGMFSSLLNIKKENNEEQSVSLDYNNPYWSMPNYGVNPTQNANTTQGMQSIVHKQNAEFTEPKKGFDLGTILKIAEVVLPLLNNFKKDNSVEIKEETNFDSEILKLKKT